MNGFEKGDQKDCDLEIALELIKSHGAIEATRKDALNWVRQAQDALKELPDHKIRDLLYDLSTYVIERLN